MSKNYGLSKDEIAKILTDAGIKPDVPITSKILIEAISEVVSKNNEKLQQQHSDEIRGFINGMVRQIHIK